MKAKSVTLLRQEAYLAYLDGRVKRAKQLNRQADELAAVERAKAAGVHPARVLETMAK